MSNENEIDKLYITIFIKASINLTRIGLLNEEIFLILEHKCKSIKYAAFQLVFQQQ
jgi:hypothetical protein